MTEPMTPERRARMLADVDRIRDLIEGQGLGALTIPDRRDMEALARVVRDVPDLAAEVDAADRTRDYVRKDSLEADRTLTDALKEHVPPQRRPTLVKAAAEAAGLIRRQAAEVGRIRAELAEAQQLTTWTAWRPSRSGNCVEHAEEIADFERTRDEMAAARRQAEEDRDDALREAERLRAERDAARVGVEKLREVLVAADKETTGLREERDRLAEQVRRVRDYAKGGCLGSKSTIYNRVGEDLLTIVGDGTEAGQ